MGDLWTINYVCCHAIVPDPHVITWTNQSQAYVLRLSPCVNVKLIHADPSDRKMSMPPALNTRVRDTKTEPILSTKKKLKLTASDDKKTLNTQRVRNEQAYFYDKRISLDEGKVVHCFILCHEKSFFT